MSETDQKREDDVLRRMLNTKPKPHSPLSNALKASREAIERSNRTLKETGPKKGKRG